jgi:hypothetical protein
MAQEEPDVNHWELEREDIELVPMLVETRSASGAWSETTAYKAQCVPVGSRPASGGWTDPTSIGGEYGYLVNGPALDPDQNGGDFIGFYRLVAAPETAVHRAFTLTLK